CDALSKRWLLRMPTPSNCQAGHARWDALASRLLLRAPMLAAREGRAEGGRLVPGPCKRPGPTPPPPPRPDNAKAASCCRGHAPKPAVERLAPVPAPAPLSSSSTHGAQPMRDRHRRDMRPLALGIAKEKDAERRNCEPAIPGGALQWRLPVCGQALDVTGNAAEQAAHVSETTGSSGRTAAVLGPRHPEQSRSMPARNRAARTPDPGLRTSVRRPANALRAG
ncbi:hypothetical protein IWW55_005625, partial [Coemansia sp. RSA 2706]